jgi:hypothetical protein
MSIQETVITSNGDPQAQQSCRVLLAWLPEVLAIQFLLGGRALQAGEDYSSQQAIFTIKQAKLLARDHYVPEVALVEDHGFDIATLSAIPHLPAQTGTLDWSVRVIDLTKIIAFQKAIKIDGLDERVRPVVEGLQSLDDYCIPSTLSETEQMIMPDNDGMGFTLSSLNPNLRILGGNVTRTNVQSATDVAPVPMLALSFLVSMGSSFIQVAHYRDRYFLRDGYHRAVSLLSVGFTTIPVIFIEARTFDEVGADPQTMFGYETLFGDNPPLLTDFLNDTVSAEVLQPAIRKIVRVTGEQFIISG